MQRRKILISSLLGMGMLHPMVHASDGALPKIIKIVVPATPGSSTDVFARSIALLLGEKTGSVVIVENKPGASGMLGSGYVAKGPKDGSLILINSSSLLTAGATMKKPPIDVLHDLIPVAIVEKNPLVVAVSNNSGIQTPAELIARAKAKPGQVTHGTFGIGTIAHIAEEKLSDMANIKFNTVPYKGTSLAVTDMAAGTIDMVIATYTSVAPAVKAGRAKIIAVTSAEESPYFPKIPTLASVVPGYSIELMLSLFVAAGTPPPVVASLNKSFNEIASSKKMKEMMAHDGGTSIELNPDEIKSILNAEFNAFAKLAREKNIYTE